MLAALTFFAVTAAAPKPDILLTGFQNPPESAKPHTWWHWMNGNVTKEGITADLEAMKRVGIAAAQMFTVDQGIPAGQAPYMSDRWREMTAFAVKEAGRLGLKLCIHNCAGWSSSGGPWIQPEDAMQVVGWSETSVEGPQKLSQALPPIAAPQVYSHVAYAKDIAVYAFPTTPDAVKSADFLGRTGVVRTDGLQVETELGGQPTIPSGNVIDLTSHLTDTGKLDWEVPPGKWTILRVGHVPTGKDNHPAPPEGDGLEVDKLSKEALDHHWNGMMAKVISDAGPLAGKVLNNALIDSYEVGSQNWTPKFRSEFTKRRGYDPLPMLPTLTGRIIDSREKTERFLWDYRRTIADLFAENYYGHFGDLCHESGLQFSTEPYGNGGFNDIESGVRADILMGEFWIGGAAMETVKDAASAAHISGDKIVGAESFTADEGRGKWLEEPYGVKALGDLAFCRGVNRHIFHRYAMQPWMNLVPGMTMGPWGSHFERTQTWWPNGAAAWLKYVARCQYMLQSGKFSADMLNYVGEDSPVAAPDPGLPTGYDYDDADVTTLMKATVRGGRIVLPSGTSYRMLMLPNARYMTPRVARKVKSLLESGATIYGSAPLGSPSLQNYPACDEEVRSIARELWGNEKFGNRRVGKGQLLWGMKVEELPRALGLLPDFAIAEKASGARVISIHRKVGDADVYFVSNQRYRPANVHALFRVTGKVPELWHPETGRTQNAIAYRTQNGQTSVPLFLGPAESTFVVFRKPAPKEHLLDFGLAETPAAKLPKVRVISARYEADAQHGADVTAKVNGLVSSGEFEIEATNGTFGDPAVNLVKHLTVTYQLNGKTVTKTVAENESLVLAELPEASASPSFEYRTSPRGTEIIPWTESKINFVSGTGNLGSIQPRKKVGKPKHLDTGWRVTFPPNLGAPKSAVFPKLISWPEHSDTGIKYFSGTATYRREFEYPLAQDPNRVVRLDLGRVKNFAMVSLNGNLLASLWKPPFLVDLTGKIRPGKNVLEVKVTNLWPNRIIGDEQLPPEVTWDGNHLAKWPDWLAKGQPRPKTGRITFSTWRYYQKDSPLLESGLLGPVVIDSRVPIKLSQHE